ncbi:MAG TPA: pyridoxamine 5'-phosphate oxidase family protein [Blastocatellia bacterium]|nr:pyridoxamine 5'-phosphate oxidase family protein [Blastocatellia bacterium]
MIEIEEMNRGRMIDLLERVGYGHLGCSRNNLPYVVPVHYAYDAPLIYIYTTEGKKSEIIRVNSNICLQVEDVDDNENWESVIVIGEAVRVSSPEERETALALLAKRNPAMAPAVSIHWMDNWVRENIEVIYKIEPRMMTGRATLKRDETDASFAPPSERQKSSIY